MVNNMGVYDYIEDNKLICPHCGKPTSFSCQIKWQPYEHRKFTRFTKGDKILCVDAIYTGASGVRDIINDICDNCGKWIHVNVVVKDGIIKDIYTIDDNVEGNNADSSD